jgi:hypothetical protein
LGDGLPLFFGGNEKAERVVEHRRNQRVCTDALILETSLCGLLIQVKA